MFGLFKKRETNSESYNKMFGEITFPRFPDYKHPEAITNLYYKIRNFEREVYSKPGEEVLTTIVFPSSYYSPEQLLDLMEGTINRILDDIYVKGEFIAYSVGNKIIDTENAKVEELQNGCLRVTRKTKNKFIVKNYASWKAEYEVVRKLSFEKIKQLKNLKTQVEELKENGREKIKKKSKTTKREGK